MLPATNFQVLFGLPLSVGVLSNLGVTAANHHISFCNHIQTISPLLSYSV